MRKTSIHCRSIALISRALHALLLAWVCCSHSMAAQIMVQQVDDLHIDYDAGSHQFVLGALQRLWLMPGSGGTANPLTPIGLTLSTPQFSPDGRQIVATGGWRQDQQHLWLIDIVSGQTSQLTNGAWRDSAPVWHPDGQRIVFASDRAGSRDIWMLSIDDRTSRPVVRTRGDAYQPALSTDGSKVAYIVRDAQRYALQEATLDRRQPAQTLLVSGETLLNPQYRKDGFSISYLREHRDRRSLSLLLPIREMLSKDLHGGRALSSGRIAWQDREHYFYVERGTIHRRELAGRSATIVPMTLWLATPERRRQTPQLSHPEAPAAHPAWVLRAARILAPEGDRYLPDHDLLIENGRISRVSRRHSWPEKNIIDLGDATVIPGLIDADIGAQPDNDSALAAGVLLQLRHTGDDTVDLRRITDNRERITALRTRSAATLAISDRLLPDVLQGVDWVSLRGIAAALGNTLSPTQSTLIGRSDIRMPSAIAENFGVPAAVSAMLSRSRLHNGTMPVGAQSADAPPALAPLAPWLLPVSGNSPVRQPLSLHAELLTLAHAGVSPQAILAAATRNAAAAIGRTDLGVIDVGMTANLAVIVGDPLQDSADLLNTIAIVRQGEFISVARLLENAGRSVE